MAKGDHRVPGYCGIVRFEKDGQTRVEFGVSEVSTGPNNGQSFVVISIRCADLVAAARFTPQQALEIAASIDQVTERIIMRGQHG